MKRIILLILGVSSVFSSLAQTNDGLKERLERHVYILASDSLEGRGAGTPGGMKATMYVAEQFREIGLDPLTDSTYLMRFAKIRGNDVFNVVGVIKGADSVLSREAIVIGAHFDHLGAKTRSNGEKVIYPGADDNASGTAALIELARFMKQREGELARTVIFASFDAEELGLYGSQGLVKALTGSQEMPQTKLMVSMDMVGWLRQGGNLTIKGIAMLSGGKKILESLHTPEGLEVVLKNFDKNMMGGSDHDSFAEKGIPAFYMTTGLKSPYHKPEDTADKIDYDGLALITEYMGTFTEEFATRQQVEYSGRQSIKHSGQRTFDFGISAAIGGNHHHYRKGAVTGKSAFAWNAGIYAQINLGIFAIRPKVLYEGREALWPDGKAVVQGDLSVDRYFTTQGLCVPVDFMIKTSGSERMYGYLFVGGYYSRILSGHFAGSGYALGEGVRSDEWGWQFGFGATMSRISIEFTSRYSLSPVLSKGIAPDLRNRSSYFTMGYKF